MLISDLERRAMEFAYEAHEGQDRKYNGMPYIIHPAEVVSILRAVDPHPAMLAAAWLHDVVEDCEITNEAIREEFGDEVADLVDWVTDPEPYRDPSYGNRAKRKEAIRMRLGMAPVDAQNIKVADLMSNTRSIIAYDKGFAKIYLPEKDALLATLTKAHQILRMQAYDLLGKAVAELDQFELNLEQMKRRTLPTC